MSPPPGFQMWSPKISGTKKLYWLADEVYVVFFSMAPQTPWNFQLDSRHTWHSKIAILGPLSEFFVAFFWVQGFFRPYCRWYHVVALEMPLWLHPVHVQADGHCSPLKLSGDERSRGDKINSTLLQVAQAQDGLKAGVVSLNALKPDLLHFCPKRTNHVLKSKWLYLVTWWF